jgi:hypothetical protein
MGVGVEKRKEIKKSWGYKSVKLKKNTRK